MLWKMERRSETGEEEEAEKDKAGDEKRKRMKKVREERMSCLFFYAGGSQNVVSRLAAAVQPGNLLDMQILLPTSDPLSQKLWRWGQEFVVLILVHSII